MDWKRQRESDLHVAREGEASFVQTWDGVQVMVGDKAKFIPMPDWNEERGREVVRCLTRSE